RMGLRVWGCDVCQQVCPWNDDAQVADRPEFRPVPGLDPAPSLIDMLHMSTGKFKRRFGRTAAAWRGKKTLQRNAAVALGNTRNPRVVPALARALREDPKPLVRGAAAWALGRIGGEEARAALEQARAAEHDPSVLDEMPRALGRRAEWRALQAGPHRRGDAGHVLHANVAVGDEPDPPGVPGHPQHAVPLQPLQEGGRGRGLLPAGRAL